MAAMSTHSTDAGEAMDQALIVDFLARPESYPDRPDTVDRIDTHGAMIFLAGQRAYKLKRAVRLPYLDFSTVAKRKAVCERELALNGMTAPQLYRGLVAVTRAGENGELRLGGDGAAVDWLIEMERFGQDQLFDQLATAGKLDWGLIEALAIVIERFHAAAPIASDEHWPDSLAGVVANVSNALGRWDDETGRRLGTALNAAFLAQRDLLAARRHARLVRRCHGDLHLKNIVLLDGKPCLFDALEFDEDLARIDLLYDLAFLLMDLWHRDLKGEAHALFNHYFTRDVSELEWRGLSALPLFLSVRAGVRAMVGLDQLGIARPDQRIPVANDLSAYVSLAAELLHPAPPRLIAIGGLSGTGKSTVARTVGPTVGAAPGAIILRTDVERKLMHRVPVTDRLAGDAYTAEARRQVYARMLSKAEMILRTGHSVILDAVFDEPDQRENARRIACANTVPFSGIWLHADAEILMARVAARERDASDAGVDVVRRQLERVTAPPDWTIADAGGKSQRTIEAVTAAMRP